MKRDTRETWAKRVGQWAKSGLSADWSMTIARPEVQQQLEANVFRQAALGIRKPAAKPQ